MELVMLGSNAFAHIVEALILWISMSQMYEPKYKQLFTGCSIFLGHIVMFAVFLTNNIYAITVINLLVYIFLIMSKSPPNTSTSSPPRFSTASICLIIASTSSVPPTKFR